MNYNEETLFLLSELEKFGLSREEVERELNYSPNYIGQLLSRQSNEKVVTTLRLLLKTKVLEKELGRTPDIPNARDKDDDFKEIVSILKDIHSSLNATCHTQELNQALLKTNLLQAAKMEAIVTKRDYKAIVEDLNEASALTFQETRVVPSRNKSRSVEA